MNAGLLTVTVMAAFAAPPKVEIIAHRGESADAPENTLAAFRLAWERDADAIELDVHLTKDGQPVAIHDSDLKRIAGDLRKIAELSFDELRRIDVGSWKDPRWASERIPKLADVLATVPVGRRCFIEIKVGPEAVAPVADAIRASEKQPEQLAIISFDTATLAAAKKRLPDVPTYLVAKFKQDENTKVWSPTLKELIRDAKSVAVDGLDLSAAGPLDADAARAIKQAGLRFYVWTVDDPAIARQFIAWGADGITTNKAGWMKRELAGTKPLSEVEKIEALIRHVEGLRDAKFVRNGTAYDAKTAVRFLRGKWDNEKAKIKSAKDFIEHAASKSSTTGRPYLIRFKDGSEKPCGEYLADELRKIEAAGRLPG